MSTYEGIEEFSKWLAILGFPGIVTVIVFLFKTLSKSINAIEILQKAQKSQMRSQMLKQHDEYMSQGYIEQIYLDDWMNQYKAYHQLVGDNEVLEVKKKDLLALPNRKPRPSVRTS